MNWEVFGDGLDLGQFSRWRIVQYQAAVER
jgi:hypothetical protein